MRIFVPVPAGNVPSQEKIRGGKRRSRRGRRSKAHLSLLSGNQGLQVKCTTFLCHSHDGPLSPPLGGEVSI